MRKIFFNIITIFKFKKCSIVKTIEINFIKSIIILDKFKLKFNRIIIINK